MTEPEVIVSEIDMSKLVSLKPYSNELPRYYRHTKAVRRHHLGRYKQGALKNYVFFIFLCDYDFGLAKFSVVHGRHVRQKANGECHIDYRTKHRPQFIIACAMQMRKGYTQDEVDTNFEAIHAQLRAPYEKSSFSWFNPEQRLLSVPENFTDYDVMCADSFAKAGVNSVGVCNENNQNPC